MSLYDNYLGTTFKVGGVSKHSYADFGLWPVAKPEIPPAEIKAHYVDIPGADGAIDMSEWPQGYATFKNRKGRFQFACTGRGRYDAVLTSLTAFLHGKTAYIVKDDEPTFRYNGRAAVEKMECDAVRGVITVTAELEPFKYELYSTTEDWIWDTFSFETGVIREYSSLTVNTSKTVTVWSSPAGGSPVFTCSADMTVTYNGVTYNLSAGENALPEILLPRELTAVTMTFTSSASATVSIDFLPGYL